jgi:hypothetical protein
MLRDVGRHQGADTYDRLLVSVEDAAAHLDGDEVSRSQSGADVLAETLAGTELAQVRLVVASLGLQLDTAAAQVSRG